MYEFGIPNVVFMLWKYLFFKTTGKMCFTTEF